MRTIHLTQHGKPWSPQTKPAGPRDGQRRRYRAIARRLALSVLPLPLLAVAGLAAPVATCLWLAVALYVGLIAWARGGVLIKFLEIGAAVTLGSLALVTLGP